MIATTVSTSTVVLIGAVYLACAVEMVEALTIVLAVGHTRGWRSALEGTGAALLVLGALVAAFGPALVSVPINVLRLVVGGVLLVFGLQWLRKAVLRASGLKARHDEDEAYREAVARLEASATHADRDRVAFVMAFKGVFLEGLEVVIAVLTLGTSAHRLSLAVVVAAVAVVSVGLAGVVVARQLSRVPENAMKMGVGVMLVSFGTFWTGEGLHVKWPGNDAMILFFVGLYLVVAWLLIAVAAPRCARHERGGGVKRPPLAVRLVVGFARFWWDFLVGDTPEIFLAALATIGVISLVSVAEHANTLAVVLLPVLAVAALTASVLRATRAARRR